jgi:hypothetical protein
VGATGIGTTGAGATNGGVCGGSWATPFDSQARPDSPTANPAPARPESTHNQTTCFMVNTPLVDRM